MFAIITGDIINSRNVDVQKWMPELKTVLNKYGSEPRNWEIYRGDSFQIEVLPNDALKVAILIKSTAKQFKLLDVRLAIEIGEKTYESEKITESNGSAFIYYGESFEKLKKQTLTIQTIWKDFNQTMNLMFGLASLTMDSWTPTSSLIIKTAIESDHINQKELALLLNKKTKQYKYKFKKRRV
jgi:hypothetical protein